MGTAETDWERVHLPVLRFVAGLDYGLQWRFDRGAPTDELPALTGEDLDAALRQLEGHGLITAGDRTETIGYFFWSRLRLAPNGWRVLGEWPPSSEADMGAALVHILRALAEEAAEEEAKPLRRAAGSVSTNWQSKAPHQDLPRLTERDRRTLSTTDPPRGRGAPPAFDSGQRHRRDR